MDYLAAKHAKSEVLNSIVGGTSDPYSVSTARAKQAFAKLVDRAVASDDIRLDLYSARPKQYLLHMTMVRRLRERLNISPDLLVSGGRARKRIAA